MESRYKAHSTKPKRKSTIEHFEKSHFKAYQDRSRGVPYNEPPLYFGWLRAKTIGLRQLAVLARKTGSCDTSGVMSCSCPIMARAAITVYGVQATTHKSTLVMATLATLISALSEDLDF